MDKKEEARIPQGLNNHQTVEGFDTFFNLAHSAANLSFLEIVQARFVTPDENMACIELGWGSAIFLVSCTSRSRVVGRSERFTWKDGSFWTIVRKWNRSACNAKPDGGVDMHCSAHMREK